MVNQSFAPPGAGVSGQFKAQLPPSVRPGPESLLLNHSGGAIFEPARTFPHVRSLRFAATSS
jgi:hypothetical protein